jgi:cyclophilin family peptidyl-prolyl cis-trans isomerase
MIAALSSSVLAFGPPSSRFAGRHAFKVSRSNLAAAAMANPMATFKTSMGDFTAELYADKLPITAGNFADLAKTGFYDGLSFHRVISGFMCQFGCPNSKDPMSPVAGTGGPAPGTSFTLADGTSIERNGRGCIPDELVAEISNDPGTLSMANTGQPDTGGSQIFVNLVRNDFLDYFNPGTPSKHPVFGKVVEGMDVVEAIGATPTNKAMGDRPVTPVVVETIVIS